MSVEPQSGPLGLDVVGLSKSFRGRVAVDRVSFRVAPGEVLGVLGPNGAGKSTTMRMIAGILDPDAGTARIAGHDILTERISAQSALGFLGEGAPAYGDMRARDFLAFIARARGMPAKDIADAVRRAATDAQLGEALDRPIETLSKGFKRRVGLAGALVADPPVLMLDEPTDGLDPNQKIAVRDLIAARKKDKAILISTHSLEEVETMCDRALIIAFGRIVAEGDLGALKAQARDGLLANLFRDLTMAPSAEAA